MLLWNGLEDYHAAWYIVRSLSIGSTNVSFLERKFIFGLLRFFQEARSVYFKVYEGLSSSRKFDSKVLYCCRFLDWGFAERCVWEVSRVVRPVQRIWWNGNTRLGREVLLFRLWSRNWRLTYVMPHVSPPSSTQLSFLLYLVYTSRIETILLMRRSAEFRSITPTSLSWYRPLRDIASY